MRYRLALDLGTSSIGLAAYELDEESEPVAIPYHAVRIFQEPLNPGQGVGEPKTAARRAARQMRRQIERKARRHRRLAQCLALLGLEPRTLSPDNGQTIHRRRAEAADRRIELEDFARVLLHMSKRRGYAGGFRPDPPEREPKPGKKAKTKPDADDKDDKAVVKPGIERLKAAMVECGAATLGQYLAHRRERGMSLKLAPEGAETKLYAHRDMLADEFERLWTTQAQYHSVLNASHEGKPIKAIFHEALFFQRPLKSPAAAVGGCPLEPGLPRAPMAQPAAQAFRIEKQLADLRWGMGRHAAALSGEQKAVLRELLRERDKLPFKDIYPALEQAGCPKPPSRGLNMDRASREELAGDKTRAAWRKLGLLPAWDELDRKTQIQVVNFIADLGSPEQLYADDWQNRFVRKVRAGKNAKGAWLYAPAPKPFGTEFLAFVDRLKACAGYGRLSAMGFDAGRSAYSVKALEKLAGVLREREGLDAGHERAAIERAYPCHYAEKPLRSELPPPPLTGNPVVDVALRQVDREIRLAIKELGGLPEEIVVELAREMALGVGRRNEIENENKANQTRRKKAAEDLRKEGCADSNTNILKYLLWKEQDGNCPYCADPLGIKEVADGQATHIEHILPHSLTRVGRKRDQLVLAHAACNHDKGGQTPWDAWGGDPPKNPSRWVAVADQAKRFRAKKLFGKSQLLELQDWTGDDSVENFTARQFQETAWIAKHTAQWLRSVCAPGKVQVSRGEMTAHLRRIWHLETVIPEARFEAGLPVFDTEGQRVEREDFDRHRAFWEGREQDAERTDRRIDKRVDHRHHLIDALVIGLCTPALYRKMAREYKDRAERRKHGERVKLGVNVPPPFRGLRKRALELVQNCNLTHKPDRHPDGALFKETAYGVAEISADGATRWRLSPEALRTEDKPQGSRRRLTLRKRLADFAGDKDSAEKVREKLGDIASPEVRKLVLDAYDRRIADGAKPQQALREPIEHPQYATPIKAVKVFVGNKPGQYLDADEARPVIHRSRHAEHYKLLLHEGNACLDVWTDGNGVKTRLLKPVEALREKGKKPPPGVKRFFKGDTVFDPKSQRSYLVKQIKSGKANGGILVTLLHTEAREIAYRNAEGNRVEIKTAEGRKDFSSPKDLCKLEIA